MNIVKSKALVLLLVVTSVFSSVASADTVSEVMTEVKGLQKIWEQIKYGMEKDKQEEEYLALAKKSRKISEKFTDRAEPLIWEAIIVSSYAGARGGLGALEYVENARDLLLKAEKINPGALQGSVYTSLGSLYYQVPGWPIGFGDDDKARTYLKKALAINADGIDSNFFYGDFLYEQEEYEEALIALNKALQAPPRAGRELSDKGRREEIAMKIADVKRQL